MILSLLKRWMPARYVLVGGCAALLQNVIMILTDRAGYHFMVGNILCFLIVGSLSFLVHSTLTFRRDWAWTRYFRYMAGLLSSFFVASILFFLLCTMAGLSMTIVAPLVTMIMLVYNYLSARWAILLQGRRAGTRRLTPSAPEQ